MVHAGLLSVLCLSSVLARQDPGYDYEDAQQEDVPQEFGEDSPSDELPDSRALERSWAQARDEAPDSREQSSRMSFLAVNNRAQGQQRAAWGENAMDSQEIPASFARIAQNIRRWKKPADKPSDKQDAAQALHEFSQGWRDMGHDVASAAAQKEAMAVVSKLHINGHPQGHKPQPAPQVHQVTEQAQGTDNDDDADDDNVPDPAQAETTPRTATRPTAKPSMQKPAWYHVPKVERQKPTQPVSQSSPPPNAPVSEDAALADAADREIEAEALDAPGADIPPLRAEFDDAAAPKQAQQPETKTRPKKQQQQEPKQPLHKQPRKSQQASPPSFPLDGPDGNEVGVDGDSGSADDDAAIASALKEAGLSTESLSLKNVDKDEDPVSPPAPELEPNAVESAAEPEAAAAPIGDMDEEAVPPVDQGLDSDSSKNIPQALKVVDVAKAHTPPPPHTSEAPAQSKAPTQSKAPLATPNTQQETLSRDVVKAAKPSLRPDTVPQASAASAAPQPAPDTDVTTNVPADVAVEQADDVTQPAPNVAQAIVSDATVDAAAHEEVARVRAELAAGEVARAAASRRKSVAMAQKLEQQARQLLRDSDAAWGRAQQAAASAAQRAAAEYKASHMQKVKELQEKSRQASEQARRTRAAADAEVNRAMQRLGQISA